MVGSMLAYLWYNSPPAEIYMGDAGSIGFGGAIGMMFVLLKIELFLPIVGGVFLAEALSVLLQISGFKFTKRFSADRTGRRIFLRARTGSNRTRPSIPKSSGASTWSASWP
jgi:phospho-N-acetylmuramoyl-pentapeptide-transferase